LQQQQSLTFAAQSLIRVFILRRSVPEFLFLFLHCKLLQTLQMLMCILRYKDMPYTHTNSAESALDGARFMGAR